MIQTPVVSEEQPRTHTTQRAVNALLDSLQMPTCRCPGDVDGQPCFRGVPVIRRTARGKVIAALYCLPCQGPNPYHGPGGCHGYAGTQRV
jgi:hypothetical protein